MFCTDIINSNRKCNNLNVFGWKVYEKGVERFRYTMLIFDPFQQRMYDFPVVDTAANVLRLVIVRAHSIALL